MTTTTFDRDELQTTIRETDKRIRALLAAFGAGHINASDCLSQRAALLAVCDAAHRRLMALG